MKIHILCICTLLGVFAACKDDDKINNSDQTQEVSFAFNLGDKGPLFSKNADTDPPVFQLPDTCKSIEELRILAENGDLRAQIKLSKNNSTPIDLDVNLNVLTGGEIVSDATALSTGSYTVESVLIISNLSTDKNPIFAGVKHGSEFSPFIQEGKHMGEITFAIGEDDTYTKKIVELHVLCASRLQAEAFGFKKWDIDFIQVHCFPFLVNICDNEKGDIKGSGSLMIEYKKNKNDHYEPLDTIFFDENSKITELCFKDNYSYNNKTEESHRLTLKLDGNYTSTKEISTEELLNFKKSASWNEQGNYMHLNFCECTTWIFDCPRPEGEAPCLPRLRFVEGNSATGGSDNYLEFWEYKSDGDLTHYEIFQDYTVLGIGDIANYDTNASTGVFSLKKGLLCRSVNAVPYSYHNKIMQIILNIKAPSTVPGESEETLLNVVLL